MGRPIYAHELNDPDFAWLIDSFKENHPDYSCFENDCLPMVFIGVEPKLISQNRATLPFLAEADRDTEDKDDPLV